MRFGGDYVFSEGSASDGRKASRGSANQNVTGLTSASGSSLGPSWVLLPEGRLCQGRCYFRPVSTFDFSPAPISECRLLGGFPLISCVCIGFFIQISQSLHMWKIDDPPISAGTPLFYVENRCQEWPRFFCRAVRATRGSAMAPTKKATGAEPKQPKVKGLANWCQEDTAVRSNAPRVR